MSLKLKHSFLKRCLLTSRSYCDGKKSIYEREEEGKKPRLVHGQPYPEWRRPWTQRDGEWTSKLSLFNTKNPSAEVLNAMQKVPNLDFKQISQFWSEMKVVQQIQNQKYLPERVAVLGSNLAALHFFTFRNCPVRLKDSKHWICGEADKLDLPSRYEDGYFVEAIDCTNFHHSGIRYEGLQNLSGLNFLKWLSVKNNKYVDVWCLDRIAGQNGLSLEYLDITGCNICVGCVHAFARMPALKILTITDPGDNILVQAALSILEQEKPDLLIKIVEDTPTSTA